MTAPAAQPNVTPAVIVLVKLDTLGDLVLFAPTVQSLRTGWPTARIVVVIRRAYSEIGPLLAREVEWVTTSLDPFGRGPRDDAAEFDRVRDMIAALKPDVVVAATSQRNWADIALAATTGAARRIALGSETEDEYFATQLRLEFGIKATAAFTHRIAVDPAQPDWRRNLRVASMLLGRTVADTQPSLTLGDAESVGATAFLASHHLAPRQFVICAAAGFANVSLKTWPADRFAAVLRHVRQKHGCRALLVGDEAERPYLEKIAAAAADDAVVWAGRAGSLPELAALIARARMFIGNDTGTMHLAAALDVPIVAVFGGGTWPRFVPAGKRTISVVQPLPCFGCAWDCAFGDAPCITDITSDDVISAVDFAFANQGTSFSEIRAVEHCSASTAAMMAKAAAQYNDLRHEHLARQRKLEELTALDREKDETIDRQDREMVDKDRELVEKEHELDQLQQQLLDKDAAILEKEREINALKAVCDEREKALRELDANRRERETHAAVLAADKALLEKALHELPSDQAAAARALVDRAVHVRNLEALLTLKDRELTELRATAANYAAGRQDLEQAKHYGRLLSEKEAVIRGLRQACEQRETVIKQLTAEATTATAKAHKLWRATRSLIREKAWRPFDIWLFRTVVERYWMQIGVLRHYDPRPLKWDDRVSASGIGDLALPQIGIVTPSYGQERFIEHTILSVLDQHYPKLQYSIQDGASKDRSPEIIARYADRLQHWESLKDNGQADAICRGFKPIVGALRPDDIMAWLNSDDLLGPGVLRFVAEYFVRHPEVDAVYGHRIIIDDDGREIGRWIMPRHNAATLEWIDYVPQETLFWRKRAWDRVGGIDPSFQFALDWDLLARFQQAGCNIVRVPYFLGAFRVHADQKTSQAIHTTGADEMRRIRTRFHGERQDSADLIERHARDTRFWGAVTARLHEIGIRW